ncbi:hypothetical protein BaRGS_00023695, partial [Batillaria attramentaria]
GRGRSAIVSGDLFRRGSPSSVIIDVCAPEEKLKRSDRQCRHGSDGEVIGDLQYSSVCAGGQIERASWENPAPNKHKMSFFKFWGKKGKSKEDLDAKKKEEEDAEAEKRRLRHSLSISRSGRFKQKKRERGGILERPELFGMEGEYTQQTANSETSSSASTSSAVSSSSSTTATNSRSQQNAYRDAHNMGTGRHVAT